MSPDQEGRIKHPGADWSRTRRMADRLRGTEFYEEPDGESRHGYFKGRPIIGRDTRISGGVYVGAGQREAIVVDEKHGKLLKVYADFLRQLDRQPNLGTAEFLDVVYSQTVAALPTNPEEFERIMKETRAMGKDEAEPKAAIDNFIGHAGKCRHKALLAGYLIEKSIDQGKAQGQVSIDRNYVPGEGAHAWARYTDPAGEVYIIDPSLGYKGKMADVNPSEKWFYLRPEDEQHD